MSKDTSPRIEDLFHNLDKWRHFAGFPLEARVDALIGLFLPKVIEDHFRKQGCEVKLQKEVIPQFPLRKEEDNQSDKASNRSYKVDFFAASECGEQAFLIEIKTDMDSRNSDQSDYLEAATKKSTRCILSDLKKMARSRNLAKAKRRKYLHMLYELSEMGLVKLPCGLEDKEWSREVARGVFEYICKIDVCKSPNPKVVYIQPREDDKTKRQDFEYIYFQDIANSIDSVQNQSELGKFLAQYLRKWKMDAGESSPWEL